jgi:FkbM family methyltransferase
MNLWGVVKQALRRVGIEAMGRSTFERLRRDALLGSVAYSSTLSVFGLLVEREFLNRSPFVLQIGANDGISYDPLWELRELCSWRGILVEPQPEAFAKLQTRYKDVPGVACENVAIGPTDGELKLFRVRLENGELDDLLTSARYETLKNTLLYVSKSGTIESVTVPMLRVDSLLQKYGVERVDLLLIDTEGMDAEIISSFNFERYQPRLIYFEIINLQENEVDMAMRILQRHGYLHCVTQRDVVAFRPSNDGKCWLCG